MHVSKCAVCAVLMICGCGGGPSRVPAPSLRPAAAAQEAFRLYDKDGDGFLDPTELDASPALKKAVNAKASATSASFPIDQDQDKKLSLQELTTRLEGMVTSRVGRMTVACAVVRGNQPLPGVDVRFIPEPFMGSAIRPAQGKTDETGVARVAVEGEEGMTFGFYRVELSRKNAGGRELIPARYNAETELGQEVSVLAPEIRDGVVVFRIGS